MDKNVEFILKAFKARLTLERGRLIKSRVEAINESIKQTVTIKTAAISQRVSMLKRLTSKDRRAAAKVAATFAGKQSTPSAKLPAPNLWGTSQSRRVAPQARSTTVFCTNCGARLKPGAAFCADCGTRIQF
jgi:hypothetical protein